MADTVRHGHTDDISDLMFALASAQGEFPDIPKNREGKIRGVYKKGPQTGHKYEYKFKYADIADILSAVRPILSKHKLAFLQIPYDEDGNLRLKTSLYLGAQCLWSDAPVSTMAGDFKEIGAAMTYARRVYGAPMLGVAAEEDTIDRNGMDKDVMEGDDTGPGKRDRADYPAGEAPSDVTRRNNKFLDANCLLDSDTSAEEREKMIIDMSTCDTITELREWAAKSKPLKDQLQPKDSEIVVAEFKKIEVTLAAKRINEMVNKEGPKTVVTSKMP